MAVLYLRVVVLLLAGLLSGCEAVVSGISNLLSPPQQLHLVRSLTTRWGDDRKWDSAQNSFADNETVYFYTVTTWDHVERSAGLHKVSWKWYSGDKLVGSYGRKWMFPHAPYHIYGNISAIDLGSGHHRVELYVDDKLFDTAEFDVVPKAAA